MPRTSIAVVTPKGPYPDFPIAALSMSAAGVAADVANKNQFPYSGREIIIARNSGGTANTVTLTSNPDEHGRSGDITAYSIPAGDVFVFNAIGGLDGWKQADGMFYLEASNVAVLFTIVSLPV